MIIQDLSKSFNPCPKINSQSKKKHKRNGNKRRKKFQSDFCIMPKNEKYGIERSQIYSNRHEVFFGRAYRNKSIQDGLIVFLTDEDHEGTDGVHGKNGDKLNRFLKKIAQKAWMDYYHKSKDEFRERYGQNCL